MTIHTISERWLEGLHGAMRYWSSTPEHGLPVVLVHGYGGMIEHWRAVTRPIARQHRLVALDLYYFGRSAIPKAPPSRRLWSDQLAELIAEVCHTPPVVIGHSLGGMVAAQLAYDYPQFVRGLVLVASVGLSEAQRQQSPLDSLFVNVASSPVVGELLANVMANGWGAQQGLRSTYYRGDRVTPELVEQFSAPLRRPGGKEAYLAVSRSFPQLCLDFPVGAVKVPTLLIWGDRDSSIPPALASRFQRDFLPQAEIAIIPKSGHCPFDETPQEFCDILLPWLSRMQNAELHIQH